MSYTVSNGFALPDLTLDTAYPLLDGFRKSLDLQGAIDDAALHALNAAQHIDRDATRSLRGGDLTPLTPSPLARVWREIDDKRRNLATSSYREPRIDFSFSLVLFPTDAGLYGMIFSEQSDWIDSFLSQPFVLPQPYWNSSDGPADVSEADWEARGALWKNIFGRDAARRPSHCGITVEMSPFLRSPKVDQVVAAQPSLESRLDFIARETMVHDISRQNRDQTDEDPLYVVIRAISFVRSAAGAELLDAYKQACLPLIPERLGAEDFMGGDFSVPRQMPPLSG